MEFDLMYEFERRIQEVKKGFNNFPKEWEYEIKNPSKFINFAKESLEGTLQRKIPFDSYLTPNFFTGFLKSSPEDCKKYKILESYFYLENGNLKYLQQKFKTRNFIFQQCSFIEPPYSILRTYGGIKENNLELFKVMRIGSFFPKKTLSLIIYQDSKNEFEINFLKNRKKKFNIFLNSDRYDFHKSLVSAIHASPLIFSDIDILKTYFGKHNFEMKDKEKSLFINFDESFEKWESY